MTHLLVFLHLVGLMLGAGGGFASSAIMRKANTMPPDQAATVRGLGPMLANVAGTGLVVLWLTGLILIWQEWGGLGNLPGAFWIKFLFVLILTAATGLIHRVYAEIRRGRTEQAERLPVLGPIAGISSLLAVLFAVIAFGG